MKYAIILLSLFGCVFTSSCSKGGAAAPAPHNIKVTVTSTASFSIGVSAVKADETVSTALDTKTVTSGSYEYNTGLVIGSDVRVEIRNAGSENTLSYAITDNGAPAVSESGKELGSFSQLVVLYTVK